MALLQCVRDFDRFSIPDFLGQKPQFVRSGERPGRAGTVRALHFATHLGALRGNTRTSVRTSFSKLWRSHDGAAPLTSAQECHRQIAH